jgi:protein gp37
MIDISKGRYWDLPWQLVDGCTPCSPGCDHCWSARMAHRFREDLTEDFVSEGRTAAYFNGKIIIHSDRLSIPLKRRKPTVYNLWNDLFHETVPDELQREGFEVMRCEATGQYCHDHTFLVLTKRPQAMANFITRLKADKGPDFIRWPLPWVYLGLTVCNQQEADEKIPVFLQVPGKKFLSLEPMLGVVELMSYLNCTMPPDADFPWHQPMDKLNAWAKGKSLIAAVILGGETGPGARPIHPDWVRSVRDQCAAAGVPFFFKAWGEWSPEIPQKYCKLSGKRWSHASVSWAREGSIYNPLNPPPDHFPSVTVYRVGRKTAGRLLDGRTHDDLPWVKP